MFSWVVLTINLENCTTGRKGILVGTYILWCKPIVSTGILYICETQIKKPLASTTRTVNGD